MNKRRLSGPKVLCLGGTVLETRICGPLLPTGVPTESTASIEDRVGGSGWFLSVGCSGAGARAYLPCRLGHDPGAELIVSEAKSCGIRLITERSDLPTSRFVVLTPSGQAEPWRISTRGPPRSEPVSLAGYDALAIGYLGEDALGAVVAGYSAQGAPNYLALAPSGSIYGYPIEILQALCEKATFLALNHTEFEGITRRGDLLSAIIRGGIGGRFRVVVTNRAEAVHVFGIESGNLVKIESFDPFPGAILDPIGCGDIFTAITLTSLTCGMSFSDSVRRASELTPVAAASSEPVRKVALIRDAR